MWQYYLDKDSLAVSESQDDTYFSFEAQTTEFRTLVNPDFLIDNNTHLQIQTHT